MNRKAILFTVMTLILLSSVFVLSSSYLRRNRQMQEFVSQGARSNDLKYVSSDIVSDYFTILNIELDEIKRGTDYVEIKFSNFSTLRRNSNYSAKLAAYENFVTGSFAQKSNKRINIFNFNSRFFFSPYNSSFSVNDESMQISFVSYKKLREVTIKVRVNLTNESVLLSTYPFDDGAPNPLVNVIVLDKNNKKIMNRSIRLNVTQRNIPDFFVLFNSGSGLSTLQITFGNRTIYNFFGPSMEYNGSMFVTETRLSAEIQRLSAKYDSVSKNTILQTEATIDVS